MRCSVDGGVAQNDFICQLLSDLTGLEIQRLQSTEMSVLGVGLLAGMAGGVWKSTEEICELKKINQVFTPNDKKECLIKRYAEFQRWEKAVERFKMWYKDE